MRIAGWIPRVQPAILTDRGLGPALEALATRAPMEVSVEALLEERFPEPVEAAAYYLVAEALTNAARHAGDSVVDVHVTRTDGHARIEVRDDGAGGAEVGRGSGLRGLADRFEALGGRLEINSPRGAGTTVTGDVPLTTTLSRPRTTRLD